MKNLFTFKTLFLVFTGLLTQATLMAQVNPPIIGDLQIRGKIDASASVTDLTSLFIGINAGLNDDGTNNANTFIGVESGRSTITGAYNTAIGLNTLYSNDNGYNNTAIGAGSLYYNIGGYDNTATGFNAMAYNTTGNFNTANGKDALYSNTTGYYNTATGVNALYSNTEGNGNIASGAYALYSNSTGSLNTANGANALYSNITGSYNVANGIDALYENTSGDLNTAIGMAALHFNTDGSANTAIGYSANVSLGGLLYATAIGSGAIAKGDHETVIGSNAPGVVIGGYANWSNLSDGRFKEQVKENVPGMDFIRALRPVTYIINIDKLQRHITAQMPDTIAAKYLPTAQEMAVAKTEIKTGFIAQEVEATAKKIGYKFDGVNAPKNETDNYSIAYAQFVPSIVKGMQEQQVEIDAQQQQIKKLAAENKALTAQVQEIDELKARLDRLEKLLSFTTATTNATITSARLDQNQPNPFNSNTAIRYFIPEGARQAELRIQDVAGKLIKTIVLEGSGEGQANLEAQTLSTGTYVYTLVLDGKVIETKKMVLTRNN